MIRENDTVKGITIGNVEHKIAHYADDTEYLSAGDRASFEACIHTIEKFGKVSDL